jgi:hypothetical protein
MGPSNCLAYNSSKLKIITMITTYCVRGSPSFVVAVGRWFCIAR